MNIKDIAKLAGVGVSTVSRVINNHPDVKEDTRRKIIDIIKEHNYIPNSSARVLKRSSTKNIGVLVKGVFNPFFSEMISTIGSKINESGYSMLLEHNDYNTIEDIGALTAFIKEKKLQGVICLGGNYLEISEESLQNIEVPVVLTSVNTISKKMKKQYSSIGIDNVIASKEVTEYLVNKGHEKIAIILGEKNDIGISWWRFKGYREALLQNNIELDENLVLIGNYSADGAYETTKNFLQENKDVTAIFAISDVMAMGAGKAIVESDFKIGEDISLVGFDGLTVSKFYNPGITTVTQPKLEMAEKSIELLLELIKGKTENKHIIMKTELIERDSSRRRKGVRVDESI